MLSALEIQAIQISSSFSSSAKTATVHFGIAQLELGGCHETIEHDPLTYRMDKQSSPKDIMCNASKEHICHHREFDVR